MNDETEQDSKSDFQTARGPNHDVKIFLELDQWKIVVETGQTRMPTRAWMKYQQ